MQRCAEFVAHAREKFALQAVGPLHFAITKLELLVNGLNLLFSFSPIAHVANDGGYAEPFFRFYRAQTDLNGNVRAILAPRVEQQAAPHGARLRVLPIIGTMMDMPRAKMLGYQDVHRLTHQLVAAIAKQLFSYCIEQ